MRKKITAAFVALLIASAPVLGQGSILGQGGLLGQSPLQSGSLFTNSDNIDTRLEIGTGVTSFARGNSMVNSYISPSVSYNFDSGLSLTVGGTFSTGNQAPRSVVLRDGSGGMSQSGSHSVFAAGKYNVNENLTISGLIFHEEGNMQVRNQPLNPALNYSRQGASMKLDYSINDRLHFGAGVTVTEGTSPYHSPFGGRQNVFGSRSHRMFP